MEDLHGKAWALVTLDEENMREVLRSAEENFKRSELFVEQIPRAVQWVEADDEHHVEEDENQVDLWAAGGDDCLLEGSDIPEVHLLDEHTGIQKVQAVPEVPVEEEMFLGCMMAVGLADSVTPSCTTA